MPETILVVDDNDTVVEALSTALCLMGYSVVCAQSIADAWILFGQHRPRAVITDNTMPGGACGLDLAKRIKSTSPEVPVIMLSGIPPQEATRVCDVVLAKPVPLRVLCDALRGTGVCP